MQSVTLSRRDTGIQYSAVIGFTYTRISHERPIRLASSGLIPCTSELGTVPSARFTGTVDGRARKEECVIALMDSQCHRSIYKRPMAE
jgi:hypothetical protein